MILIDIGNSKAHMAYCKNGVFTAISAVNTMGLTKDVMLKALSRYNSKEIVACSVVPAATSVLEGISKNYGYRVNIAGKSFKVPMRCFYNPRHVGQDRIVGAFAVNKLYHSSRIIIDFGTAITFDFLSVKGEYLGGFILPGIGSTLKTLSMCAMLPDNIKLKHSRGPIPRDTGQSISKGIEEGFSAMINSMARKYIKLLKISPADKVVVTGGDGAFILPRLDFPSVFDPHLVFKGLYLLALTRKCRDLGAKKSPVFKTA